MPYNYWGERTDYPPELPVNDEARNDAHIANTGMRLY